MPVTTKTRTPSAANDRMLSVKDVAEILQCCSRTVIRRIEEGELVAHKPCLKWRIKRCDLDAFIDGARHDR